jgi:hypothetical protein
MTDRPTCATCVELAQLLADWAKSPEDAMRLGARLSAFVSEHAPRVERASRPPEAEVAAGTLSMHELRTLLAKLWIANGHPPGAALNSITEEDTRDELIERIEKLTIEGDGRSDPAVPTGRPVATAGQDAAAVRTQAGINPEHSRPPEAAAAAGNLYTRNCMTVVCPDGERHVMQTPDDIEWAVPALNAAFAAGQHAERERQEPELQAQSDRSWNAALAQTFAYNWTVCRMPNPPKERPR